MIKIKAGNKEVELAFKMKFLKDLTARIEPTGDISKVMDKIGGNGSDRKVEVAIYQSAMECARAIKGDYSGVSEEEAEDILRAMELMDIAEYMQLQTQINKAISEGFTPKDLGKDDKGKKKADQKSPSGTLRTSPKAR